MKLRRFLALALSLAMVLTIVPAFGLTASAAGTTGVIDVLGATVLWSCPDGSFNDTAIADAFSGWTSNITSGYVNVKTYSVGNVIQYYVNGTENKTTITSPGYGGDGEDAIIIEWKAKGEIPSDLYFDFSFTDKDGAEIAFLKLDKNFTSVSGEYYMGYPAEGTDCAIVATNNADGTTHKVEYYVAGEVVATVAEKEGVVNGFGGIKSSNGRWSTTWKHIGFADLTIAAYTKPAAAVDVTATYTVNGTPVKTVKKTYDSAVATGAEFDAVYYSVNGENVIYKADATTLSADTEIELAAAKNADVADYEKGKVFANNGKQYEVKSDNLIPNGDFKLGTMGWYCGTGASASFFTSNNDGTMTTTSGGGGQKTAGALYRAWKVEPGKTYIYTYTSTGGGMYHMNSLGASFEETGADGSNKWEGVANTNNVKIFTAGENENYLIASYRWLGSGDTFGNFGLYEIEEAQTTVTETVSSVADIADVKVIGDTEVVLPATVKVTGSLGSVVNASIAWDAPTTYNVGTTEVSGKATVQFGEQATTEEDVTVSVTVLERTFALSDMTSVNGQTDAKANQVVFPVAISDEFNIEFTANYASFGDLWITLKTKDAGFFSPEQIPLGVNNDGKFRPVNGNGNGGRAESDADRAQLSTGVDYRFFVTTNASTDKYTVAVYNKTTGEELAVVENFGYRTNADAIECITTFTNNGAGSVTISDIKVNANVSKTEYTFQVEMDGNISTSKLSYWSLEEAKASIVDIPGYEKTVTVDGTTIKVVYSATQNLKATFVDANENVIKEIDEVVAIGGTFKVDAEEIFYLDADYTGHIYAIPETVLSADNNNLVVTVNEVAGKYPVMEDALVSDNEIWGIKKTNNNSVFVAAGADANQAPTKDANGNNNHDADHYPSTLGKSRVGFVQFPVVDFEDGQKVTANFYVREWHGNGFSNGNTTLRLAAYAVNDDSWTALSDGGKYDSANATLLETWNTPVFSDVCYKNVGYITFDITEIMAAAKAANLETITLRLNAPYGAAYIAEREACVAGGAYAGKVAYVEVKDAGLVKVTETGDATLTKNGSEMNGFAYVAATDDVRLNATGAIVVGTAAGYYEANKTMSITEATTFANTAPAKLGLAMVDGAQVRIGNTNLAAGEKLNAMADSGIRFIATADYNGTVVADEDVEFGIKVQADASENIAYVEATKFQNDEKTAFSAAIVNLVESNYNRKYTATAYAKVEMADGTTKEFVAPTSVSRSIYQVSAGIMKNGKADAEDAPYTVDGVVKNILNAYINQTGIRLTYANGEMTVEDGKYTGDVFFTVESTTDGSATTVTITPDTTWGTKAEIAEWWTDYVRVNNNNSTAKTFISDASVDENGVLTFTFTVPAE